MCGFVDFWKGSCGSFRIFGKVYEDFWSDTPLGPSKAEHLCLSFSLAELLGA